MEDVYVTLERHEQKLLTLERDVLALRDVQAEIRSMNETLVMLATELKHTNEHLAKNEKRIEELGNQPKKRLQQIVTAIISALAGGLVSIIISSLFVV